VETEDASLNEEIFFGGSPDHDCYVRRVTGQDEDVVLFAEGVVLGFRSAKEAGWSPYQLKNLDGAWCSRPTRPGKWWDPTARETIILDLACVPRKLGTSRMVNLDARRMWHLTCVQRHAGCSSASAGW
jgi:hypothetical protein